MALNFSHNSGYIRINLLQGNILEPGAFQPATVLGCRKDIAFRGRNQHIDAENKWPARFGTGIVGHEVNNGDTSPGFRTCFSFFKALWVA